MFKKLGFFIAALMITGTACAQVDLDKAIKDAEKTVNSYTKKGKKNKNAKPTNSEVIAGLKDALTQGTNGATSLASKMDGFNGNPKIRIPFPQEAIQVKNKMEQLGMTEQVNKFETTLNRAAEEAAKEAAPVFINAVKSMSIADGFAILKGGNNAATTYLKDKTTAELTTKFSPIVKNAINKVELTKYWNPLITKYNMIPGVEKKNPDLDQYVTQKALEGLFKLLADEELKIRQNPAARATAILQKVFGWYDKNK